MTTPIADFVSNYQKSNSVRVHMPGHKGKGPLGCEGRDITEIHGADSLYEASGIIAESEANATSLFDSGMTLYSTEGSSQCIRAMLFLALLNAPKDGNRPLILAARNSHKVLLHTAAMLDLDIAWLWPEDTRYSLCRCSISPLQVRTRLKLLSRRPIAVFVTSPDYLGNVLDIGRLAEEAHRYGVPLLVDDAHGAYRKFLPSEKHPLELGADACCDSAHKTLPVLTGGAYLHIGKYAPACFFENARRAMAMVGSTSPSYLILQSLDLANRTLAGDFSAQLAAQAQKVQVLREKLSQKGWLIEPTEPMKITVNLSGNPSVRKRLLRSLAANHIEYEYADPEYLVMMFSPNNIEEDFSRIDQAFAANYAWDSSSRPSFEFSEPELAMTIRQAAFSQSEKLPVCFAANRVLADPSVSCPPAVPIAVTGEVISSDMIPVFEYYGIKEVTVVKEDASVSAENG